MAAKSSIALLARTRLISKAFDKNVPVQRSVFGNNASSSYRTQQLWRSYTTEKSTEQLAETETNEDPKNLSQEVEHLTKEVKQLREKNSELTDKYKRALADSENLRVRLMKQIDDAKIFGIQSFCKDMLEVADTLGHATAAVPQNELDKNHHLKNLYQGLSMTNASLQQAFKRHGLIAVNPMNEKFDPNFHEAVFQLEKPGIESNTVIEVSKLGYKLHERCIRPAVVGVSK